MIPGTDERRPQLMRALVQQGTLTPEQRDWTLDVHEHTESPVESILVASGLVDRRYLYRVLGELWQAPFLDLTRERLDTSLVQGFDPAAAVRDGWLPVSRLGPDEVLVAGMHEPTEERLAGISARLGHRVAYAVTTEWDLRYALQRDFKEQLLDRAALGLWRRSEDQSARRVLYFRQKVFLTVALAVTEAARAARPPPTVTIVIVPRGAPQTKPKACNVGLFFARGDYLVIYDAEDKPDPDQLKRAIVAFSRGDQRLVCVQAALNYWNVDENLLTRMFTVEYSYWFDYMLPGLDALRQAIPLGGTSNHFKTEALRKLGGWDPYNVTEDADLGIRAAALGYSVGVVNSTTYEEANRDYRNWIRQRSRWIKGYMQTALVHTRHPVSLMRVAGLRATLGFLLLIAGTPITFLLVLPLYAVFLAALFLPSNDFLDLFPGWVLWVSLVNLTVGNLLMIYICMMGAFKRRRYGLVAWALLNPLYWIMHSIAAYKALWQLITKPYYWEKTAHGISSLTTAPAAPAIPKSRLSVD